MARFTRQASPSGMRSCDPFFCGMAHQNGQTVRCHHGTGNAGLGCPRHIGLGGWTGIQVNGHAFRPMNLSKVSCGHPHFALKQCTVFLNTSRIITCKQAQI
jgi:hypothetical protein